MTSNLMSTIRNESAYMYPLPRDVVLSSWDITMTTRHCAGLGDKIETMKQLVAVVEQKEQVIPGAGPGWTLNLKVWCQTLLQLLHAYGLMLSSIDCSVTSGVCAYLVQS